VSAAKRGGAGRKGKRKTRRRTSSSPTWHLDTRAVGAGKNAEPPAGEPTSTPIFASSAFEQAGADALDEVYAGGPGYVYGRYHNPTVDALEAAVADLEGAEAALAYASGMAAIAGAFAALELRSGAKILAARDLYGTTINWLETEAVRCGWEIVYVDFADRSFTSKAVRKEGPDAVYCETLSNPLVRLVDLDSLGPACRDARVPLIVDATFTPPPLLRPIEHNVTLVAHSATKYLSGHGDVIAGVVSGRADLIEKARARRTLDGTILDPFSAWLVLRGLRTLPLRIERQCANAARIANHLKIHHAVAQVHYPGVSRRDTPREKATLERLYPHGRHGAIVAFEITGADDKTARRFLDALQLWGTATTLGDVASQALVPAMTSHRHLPPERKSYLGIVPGLVRLSVGIENADDLIADLDQALEAALERR
jgi:cystathionine gamma-synthase/methionine-gamma-lyase